VGAITSAAGTKLVLVLAPAGWGKTTLLSEWRSSPDETRSFAWLALDATDNDPVKLFEGIVAALRTVEPEIGSEALAALVGPAPLAEVVLPSLLNELGALRRPLVLVLDDLHVLQNARIYEALSFMLERLPANIQVALASRSEPPLPLARLRVAGEILEITAGDLRFTDEEAGALLREGLGHPLEPEDVARLQERTEGWAAGLHLAALSLSAQPDTGAFISSFAGDDRPLVDYLGFEVLDRQPDDVRRFLLYTSVLRRLTGPLCDAVMASTGSAVRLDLLERQGLFLLPLDTKREWYRCHVLFGELLRHELARTEPQLVAELHARACEWHREHGAVDEAIHHATAGGAVATASALITEHWYEFLQRGRIETVAAWLDALGDAAVSRDAALCLTKAWIGVNTGHLDEVARWIEAAERARRGTGDGAVEAGIASLREIFRYMSGDVGAAVEAGRRSVARGGSPWRPVGCPVLGIALFWSGQPDDAARELDGSVRAGRAAGNHLAVIHASGGLAVIRAEGGDLDQADRLATEALGLAEGSSLTGHWATTMAHVVRGRALEQLGRLAEAGAELERAAERSRSGVAAVEIAFALLAQADALRLEGRLQAAAAHASEARRAVERCPDPGILLEMLARTERRLHLSSRVRTDADPRAQELTERELQILALMPTQLSQREMGSELYLSLNTIKTHVRGIYRKLNVDGRDEAVERARSLELI
jgi:LuxR family transcriptional regulator, maltose regulon positive regulatory protein